MPLTMISLREELFLPVATGGLIIAVVLGWLFLFPTNKNNEKAFPVAPTGMLENLTGLGGPRAPFWVLATARRMGTMSFQVRLPGLTTYIIGDYRLVRQILKDTASDKPRQVYKNFEGTSAKTMFTSANDAYMKSLRKSTAHAFSRTEVGRMNQVARKYVDQWMNGRLEEFAAMGQAFDPARELNYVTFLVICEAAFEYRASREEFEAFEHHSEITAREFIGKSALNPLRPLLGRFIPDVRRARASMTTLLDFSGRVLETYRKNPDKLSHNTLIKILNENTSIADDFQRKSEIKDWLTAGHDTTGYSLASTLTLLAKHPACQTKLREELNKHLGPNSDDEANTISADDCDYFRHVIKESMRVMPVAAGGSGRTTAKEYTSPDGSNKVLPAGAICFFNQYLMNRNEAVFESPDAFYPERWENPTEDMKIAMSPFALGSRACPGQPLAMAEINTVLPRLLTRYSFELVDEGKKEYFLTLKYKGTRLKAKKLYN